MKSTKKRFSSRMSKICCRTSVGSRSHGESLAELMAGDFACRLALGVPRFNKPGCLPCFGSMDNFCFWKRQGSPFCCPLFASGRCGEELLRSKSRQGARR